MAAEMLKVAGFEFREVSMKSVSCYYAMPGRAALLRVSEHPSTKPNHHLRRFVVAKLTFGGGGHAPGYAKVSEEKLLRMTAEAMGLYMLRAAQLEAGLALELMEGEKV
jgi:hypothetical protein